MRSTHRRALSYCRASTSRSPKRSHSVHGVRTAASPHAAPGWIGRPVVRRRGSPARTRGPFRPSSCSAARSSQPRGQHAGAVEEERRGRGEDLDVAGPAESLVALRAVGRDVDEVAAHAPDDVLVQAVDELVRASRTSRCARCRCGTPGDDAAVRRRRVARPAVDLGVAEAVEGEPRLPLLAALAAGERVVVGRVRLAERRV